uniref:Conotoxin Cl14.4 n=1 Tax=Californiconus californicus TaxID=1736779 RepID=CLE4_CONCL
MKFLLFLSVALLLTSFIETVTVNKAGMERPSRALVGRGCPAECPDTCSSSGSCAPDFIG